jgi:hypothetical protein
MNPRRGVLVSSLLAMALAAGACGRAPVAPPGGISAWKAPVSPPPHVLIVPGNSPSASAGSWGASSTRAHRGKITGLWSGAGRHPLWRGCQHKYDPKMTAFIYGTAASP